MVAIHNSPVLRARQTAEIIAAELQDGANILSEPDPLLAEGCPELPDPSPIHYKPSPAIIWQESARIEAGYRRYFHRAGAAHERDGREGAVSTVATEKSPPPTLDYELLVCHGNVIRYFLLRALQLDTTRWLHLATYNTGITHVCIRGDGGVSVQSFGDTGHLPAELTTYH